MSKKILGQTGRSVLSVTQKHRKRSKRRAVRFRYDRTPTGYLAWVCGPFHSALYGACATGRTKEKAKGKLRYHLACRFGYLGSVIFSDVDESATVGRSQAEVWRAANNVERELLQRAKPHVLATMDVCGTARV